MIVIISEGCDVRVASPDDTNSLEIEAPRSIAVADALAQAGLGGEAAGELHHWLGIAALRALAVSGATDPDWTRKWESMIAFAGSHGWTSADGASVMAHAVLVDG